MPSQHHVLIAAFPPAQMLDVTGPLEVFAVANGIAEARGAPPPYRLTLAAPVAGPLATTSGVSLLATHSLYDPALAPDTLLLAGGAGARAAAFDGALVAAIAGLAAVAGRVGSICTGAFMLAATGVLDGRRATTHWAHFDEFANRFPQVQIERDALFVMEGKFHASAGISAGIDYALALVEQDGGRACALEVARELVVFLKRPGGQSQFSAQMAAESAAADGDRFAELTAWIGQHLASPLPVPLLAERCAMSPRNFARRFAEAMNVAPGQYVQALRVDAARRMLTDGNVPVERVAARCGFASAEAMRLAFKRHLAIAPSQFRARFQTTSNSQAAG
ncbi:MAG TPA: helix-turn-helix domain-containing protein [Telluria sp.]|jgi:transcriptional regulator GlxA family with amidase domain